MEDNPDILWANHAIFSAEGYEVSTAESIAEARLRITERPPDAIVLDLLLPDGNSLDYLAEFRLLCDAPILILSALSEKDERLAGLRNGGDDYITKAYDIDELVARVEAFLRREERQAQRSPERIRCGVITLDLVASQAFVRDTNLLLAGKEFALLHLFVRNKGKMLSRELLYEAIWKLPLAGDDTALKNTIYRLRRKLESSRSGFDIVMSRGEGYSFIEE